MSRSGWIAIVVISVVVLLVILAGIFLLGGGRYGSGFGMNPGMGGYRGGMMGNWGFGWFGGIMMVFMWLVPLGLIALVVVGIVFLVRALDSNRGLAAPTRNCPNCGRSVRNDWHNCAYCGHQLTQ